MSAARPLPPAPHPSGRIRRVRERLRDEKLDALYICSLSNIRYLTGFSGSAAHLLVTRDDAVFYTDGRYAIQARAELTPEPADEQAETVTIVIAKRRALDALAGDLPRRAFRRLGFEAGNLVFETYQHLRKQTSKTRWKPTAGWVEELRTVKDPSEIEKIRRAVELNSRAFRKALRKLRPTWMETRLAAEIEHQMRLLGADSAAFETIVASGAHSALPHARPRRVPLTGCSLVVVDQGAILDGYASDMTRMVALGAPGGQAREIVNAVREAQQAAIDAVRPGILAGTVDRKARGVLRKWRLDRYFTHSTGHGIGLEVHEGPLLGRKQKTRLAPGMVFTIEPGVYKDGIGGARIEDVVVVTASGCEVLTPATESLLVL